MENIPEFALYLLIGWASGISIYLTIALLGICGRMGYMVLPANLEVLSHPLVIGASLLVFAVEFFADKVPLLDSAWDSIHTFIRPIGAASLVFMASSDHGPALQMTYAILTGAIALDMHAVKASTRLAVNASPEPVSNMIVSIAEDTAVVVMFWFFIQHPILASLIIIVFLVGSFFILRALWRFVLAVFRREKIAQNKPAP